MSWILTQESWVRKCIFQSQEWSPKKIWTFERSPTEVKMTTSPPSQLKSKRSLWNSTMVSMQLKAKYATHSTTKQTNSMQIDEVSWNFTCWGVPSPQDVIVRFSKGKYVYCFNGERSVGERPCSRCKRCARLVERAFILFHPEPSLQIPPPPSSTAAIYFHFFAIISTSNWANPQGEIIE